MTLPESLSTALLLNGGLLVLGNFVLSHIKSVPGKIQSLVFRHFSVTLEIPENRYPFDLVKQFMSKQKAIFKCRNHSVVRQTNSLGEECLHFPPAPGDFLFWYDGKPAVMNRTRRDLEGGGELAFFETMHIRFFGGTQETIARFIQDAENFEKSNLGVTTVYISTNGYLDPFSRKSRPASTVFLPGNLREEILGDVRRFFESADWYRSLGIPHRRGHLYHGTPGTGKTSIIRGVAAELGLKIVVISLNRKGLDDSDLIRLFASIPMNSCVILEDIDCLFKKRDGEAEVTFSGLLNAIDGVASSEGYLLCMTTNHPELLDEALVRPGRIDRKFHIGRARKDQAEAYFSHFYGPGHEELAEKFGERIEEGEYTMAWVQNFLLENRDRPVAGDLP